MTCPYRYRRVKFHPTPFGQAPPNCTLKITALTVDGLLNEQCLDSEAAHLAT
jgi:hypothetical protein